MVTRQQCSDALSGRVAPAVVDAYLKRLIKRERVSAHTLRFLRVGGTSVRPAVADARWVALPIMGDGGWTLAVADTKTGTTTVLVSHTPSPDDDGGITVLAWAECVAAHGITVPMPRIDIVAVRLELELMSRALAGDPESRPQVQVAPEAPRLQPVVRADLLDARCAISDDTVDCVMAALQRRIPESDASLMRCAEVQTWAAAKHASSFERDAQAMLAMYQKEAAARLSAARCLVMPVNAASHWVLVVAIPAAAVFYVLDSLGSSGAEAATVEACRLLAPEACARMRVERPLVPRQTDCVSCGIFMLRYAEEFVTSGGGAPACWSGMTVDVGTARGHMARAILDCN